MNFDNTNSGALFKNNKKNDRQPDYRGTINVNGTDYWLSAWLKSSKAGQKYMSLAVQPKEGEHAKHPAPIESVAPPLAAAPDFNDDIPF